MKNKKPVSKAKADNNATKAVKDSAVAQTAASVTEEKVEESSTKETTAKETAEVKKEVPAADSKTEEKSVAKAEEKPVERKRPGRKPGSKNKNTVKKQPAAKRAEKDIVQEVYFEYNGNQILSNELLDRIKEEYKNEGHRISSIKTLRVYINPDGRKAYYVINDKAEGKFVEF